MDRSLLVENPSFHNLISLDLSRILLMNPQREREKHQLLTTGCSQKGCIFMEGVSTSM